MDLEKDCIPLNDHHHHLLIPQADIALTFLGAFYMTKSSLLRLGAMSD